MSSSEGFKLASELFEQCAKSRGLKGALRVTSCETVLRSLMPAQQIVLRRLCGDDSIEMMSGSVIGFAYAYPHEAILAIAQRGAHGGYDRDAWNRYANWYRRLNGALNETAERLAEATGGVAIPATTEGIASKVAHVSEYFGGVVSHRVVAELSGLGWRGKNSLIVNPRFGCAIRLASVMTPLRLEVGQPLKDGCGGCRACLDECTFLRFRERLDDYREQCRRYMVSLGLEADVCGRCIKACLLKSIHSDRFRL